MGFKGLPNGILDGKALRCGKPLGESLGLCGLKPANAPSRGNAQITTRLGPQKGCRLVFQDRQIVLNGVPDRHEIDGVITVDQRVAHPVSEVEL
jgi:hypothetical protein